MTVFGVTDGSFQQRAGQMPPLPLSGPGVQYPGCCAGTLVGPDDRREQGRGSIQGSGLGVALNHETFDKYLVDPWSGKARAFR